MKINEYITRIKNDDKTLTEIDLYRQRLSDADLKPLMNALEAKPLIAAQIVTLKLDGNLLSSPPVLVGLPRLEILYLNSNKLSVPPVLTGLVNLEILYLDSNKLSSSPVLTGLVKLKSLHLDWNQLSAPPDLTGLVNLKILYLKNNKLSSAPILTGLVNLKILHLENNQLSSPPDLTGLVNMEILSLENNQLSAPPDLAGLVKLQQLCLDNNQLSNLGEVAVIRLKQRFPNVNISINETHPPPVLNATTLNKHCNAELKAIRLAVDNLTVQYFSTIATILSLHPNFDMELASHMAEYIMPLPGKRAMDVFYSNFNTLQQIFADNESETLLFSNCIKARGSELVSLNQHIQDRVTNIEIKLSNSVPVNTLVALNLFIKKHSFDPADLNQGNPKWKNILATANETAKYLVGNELEVRKSVIEDIKIRIGGS